MYNAEGKVMAKYPNSRNYNQPSREVMANFFNKLRFGGEGTIEKPSRPCRQKRTVC